MLTTVTVKENHKFKTIGCWEHRQNKVTHCMTKFDRISYWLLWYSFMVLEIPLVCLLAHAFHLCGWHILITGHLTLPKCFCNFTATASTQSAMLLGIVFDLYQSQYLILCFKEYSGIII